MPRDDRKPEAKADEGWFIDFDDEDALDIAALTAVRRAPSGQNRPPQRLQLRPMVAGEPVPNVGVPLDPVQGDAQPPKAPGLSSRVGSTSAKRDAAAPEPARQVAQASTDAVPAPVDVDPVRNGLEVDRTWQARPNPAAAPPERESHSKIPAAGADQRGESTGPGRVRRRIAGASLLAACLAGGVLLPIGLRSARPLTGEGAGDTPISEAPADPVSQRRSALQTQWHDPPTMAMPIGRAAETAALAPGETVGTRETILIGAVLVPPDAAEVQSAVETAPTLRPGDVRPVPPSNEERAIEPSMTAVARTVQVADEGAPAVIASAKSLHGAKRHTGPAEPATWVKPDEVRRSPSTVGIVRSSQHALPIPQHPTWKPVPAPAVRVTIVRAAPTLRRSKTVAHHPSPATTSRVASRQIAVGGWDNLEQIQPRSSHGPQVPRAEPPRALVLPTSLEPTPF